MKMLENDPGVTCITEVFQLHKFIENVLNTLVTFVIFSLEARLQQTTSNSLDLTFRPCYFVTLEYGGLAPARSVLYSKLQCVHVNL